MEDCPILGGFTLGQEDRIGAQAIGDVLAMKAEDPWFGYQDRYHIACEVHDLVDPRLDRADQHVVAARYQVHADGRHPVKRSLSAATIASTTLPWAPPSLRM